MHSRSLGRPASARSAQEQLNLSRQTNSQTTLELGLGEQRTPPAAHVFGQHDSILASRALPKFSVLSLCPESRPLKRKPIDQQQKRVRMAPIFASLGMLWGHSAQLIGRNEEAIERL
jgi:hypothetical protein